VQQLNANSASASRLSLPAVIVFSVATFPISSLAVALYVYLPPYLAGHIGVSLAAIGFAWATVRVIDIAVDPMLGHAMDRTKTSFGRYRVWLVAGVPITMLAVFMLFMAPKGVGGGYVLVWLFVLYLGFSIFSLSLWAWAATLVREYHERSRVFGTLTAVGVVVSVATLLVPIVVPVAGLDSAQSVPAMGWFIIVFTPLTVGLSVWRTKERLNPSSEHFAFRDYWDIARKPEVIRVFFAQVAVTLGPTAMSAMYLFYFRDVLGFQTQSATVLLLVYILAGVLGAPLTARLAMRIGKHQAFMATTASFSLGLLVLLLVPRGSSLAAAPVMAWCGFMATGFALLLNAMMADVGDEIRLHQNKERMSLLYAVQTLAAKVAAAGAIAITYPLLARFGYDAREGAANTHAAIVGLQWVFLAGPTVCVALGGAAVFGWKLDAHKHAKVRAELDARDSLMAAEAARAEAVEALAEEIA
jgi:Na+/melibiose symporter-like transporter